MPKFLINFKVMSIFLQSQNVRLNDSTRVMFKLGNYDSDSQIMNCIVYNKANLPSQHHNILQLEVG